MVLWFLHFIFTVGSNSCTMKRNDHHRWHSIKNIYFFVNNSIGLLVHIICMNGVWCENTKSVFRTTAEAIWESIAESWAVIQFEFSMKLHSENLFRKFWYDSQKSWFFPHPPKINQFDISKSLTCTGKIKIWSFDSFARVIFKCPWRIFEFPRTSVSTFKY